MSIGTIDGAEGVCPKVIVVGVNHADLSEEQKQHFSRRIFVVLDFADIIDEAGQITHLPRTKPNQDKVQNL